MMTYDDHTSQSSFATITKIIVFIILASIAVYFGYQTHSEPQVRFNSITHRLIHPTDTRVRFRIGVIDERFGITHDQARQYSEQAIRIWHDGTARQWFVYDETAKLTVNFIYDERQAQTDAVKQSEPAIKQMINQHEYDTASLDIARRDLQDSFTTLNGELQAWQANYNLTIFRLNNATNDAERNYLQAQYQELQQQKRILGHKIQAYQSKQDAFNIKVNKVNTQANTLNQAIDYANSQITLTEYHKGVFDGKTINIYEFRTADDLVLLLAHEFGHALSIGHNDDPAALMYPYAQEQDAKNFRLQPADIALLNNRSRWRDGDVMTHNHSDHRHQH